MCDVSDTPRGEARGYLHVWYLRHAGGRGGGATRINDTPARPPRGERRRGKGGRVHV